MTPTASATTLATGRDRAQVAAAVLAPTLLALPVLPPAVVPAGLRPRCRVGVDVASIAEVAEAAVSPSYLERVYTDHERACCTGSAEVVAAGLAARFAAKEAVVKVLRPTGPRPPWRSIEVRRTAGGACELVLSGAASQLAAEAGISEITLSLTHEGPWAAAVVVALCDDATAVAVCEDATAEAKGDDPTEAGAGSADGIDQGNKETNNG